MTAADRAGGGNPKPTTVDAAPAVLYTFRRCPYAIRARLALAAVGGPTTAALDVREVVLRDKPAAMLALSPKGTVPVLALPEGQVIDESLDVMRWALAQERGGTLVHALDGSEAETLIAENDGPFKAALDRYKYSNRYAEGGEVHTLREASYDRCRTFLSKLESRLRGTAPGHCLEGNSASPLDWAIFPFVRQFAGVEPDRFKADFPNTNAWQAHQQTTPLFRRVMTKLTPWQPNDPPLRFDTAYPP